MENGRADRDFLLSLCDPSERKFFDDRLEKEWVEFEHCGGIDHLKKRVQDAKKHIRSYIRYSAVFDSDALHPRRPSATSRDTARACFPEVHHHQLLKRSIENYLPRKALDRWSKAVIGNPRRSREKIVEAFFTLPTLDQRAHYNMKEGFEGDERRVDRHHVGALFNGINGKLRSRLRNGFDTNIAALYSNGDVRHADFDDTDAAVASVKTFVRQIIARIR